MLMKISIRKIIVASLALCALFLLYLIPDNESLDYELPKDNIEYVYSNISSVIYLLDSNDYIARTTIRGCDCDTLETAKDITKGLIIGEEKSNIIPNGFRSIIPTGTEILDINLENKILTVNFSRELLDITEKYEEKMIEALIYTLTSIEGIDKVIIKVEGEVLERLPNSNKILPTVCPPNSLPLLNL